MIVLAVIFFYTLIACIVGRVVFALTPDPQEDPLFIPAGVFWPAAIPLAGAWYLSKPISNWITRLVGK